MPHELSCPYQAQRTIDGYISCFKFDILRFITSIFQVFFFFFTSVLWNCGCIYPINKTKGTVAELAVTIATTYTRNQSRLSAQTDRNACPEHMRHVNARRTTTSERRFVRRANDGYVIKASGQIVSSRTRPRHRSVQP